MSLVVACRLSSGGRTITCKTVRSISSAPEPSSTEITQLLSQYASSPPRPLNLSALLSFGRPLSPSSVLSSVSYALSEIPRRLATRVRSLEALPFIVGMNPYVANTLKAYRESFEWLALYPPVTNLEENAQFAAKLEGLVKKHANDIPTMAKGFQECARYMSPTQINDFLDRAIRNRISVRLIAEQHIALSQALTNPDADSANVGVVNMECSPLKMINICGSYVTELCEATLGASPAIVVDGHTDATFAYVPVHLEYILTEILKNSFRATVEHHQKSLRSSSRPLPSVVITLSPSPRIPGSDPESNYFSIRVRDQGGGVSPTNMSRIFSYAFTTAGCGDGAEEHRTGFESEGGSYGMTGGGNRVVEGNVFGEITTQGLQKGMGTIAGLGYGLPMSRLYAKYFGGSLDLLSLDGWGSDVFLKLRCLDEAGDSAI